MRYMGGKTMIAKKIVAAILEDTNDRGTWFEPFVGGGNVLEHAAPHFTQRVAMDAHEDLILMWAATVAGWTPPEFVSKDLYQSLRRANSSPLRGYVGFGASFGGRWFEGYGSQKVDAKHPHAEVCRSSYPTVVRQGSVFAAHDVSFVHARFGDVSPPPGSVVYCDPPYAGTKKYSTGQFDYDRFYSTLGMWAAGGSAVYVSEYAVPDGVACDVIWEGSRRNTLHRDTNDRTTVERLFRIRPCIIVPGTVAA